MNNRLTNRITRHNSVYLHSEFKDKLKNYGYSLVQTMGDGNCLFRALSYQLKSTESDHARYRNDLCDYLECYKNYFLSFNVIDEIDNFENLDEDKLVLHKKRKFDEYVISMRKDGVYADGICLDGISMMLKKNVTVVMVENNDLITIKMNESFSQNLYFFYHDSHYSTIKRHGSSIIIARN